MFSSFALHHLTTEEKGEVFRQVSRSLRPGGVFLLVDVVRHEDESHDAHLQAACDWMRKEWHDFSPEEMATICDHVTGNDLPETVITLARRATAAGLSAPEPVNQYRWLHILAFGKTPGRDAQLSLSYRLSTISTTIRRTMYHSTRSAWRWFTRSR